MARLKLIRPEHARVVRANKIFDKRINETKAQTLHQSGRHRNEKFATTADFLLRRNNFLSVLLLWNIMAPRVFNIIFIQLTLPRLKTNQLASEMNRCGLHTKMRRPRGKLISCNFFVRLLEASERARKLVHQRIFCVPAALRNWPFARSPLCRTLYEKSTMKSAMPPESESECREKRAFEQEVGCWFSPRAH